MLLTLIWVASGLSLSLHLFTSWFLDKAAIKDNDTGSRLPCTVTQVEGAKLITGMAMIWLVTLIPSTMWAQINTLFVKQGTTLDSHLGSTFQIPAASLGSFVILTMLLSVPMYDRYFVPFMRNKTGNPRGITLLQRLGTGFLIQILAIVIAYGMEYVLLGVADVFNAIGLLEFFYDQSPEDMQSLATTFFTSGIGLGNFLNSFLVTMVDKITGSNGGKSWIGDNMNDSHLDYYYGFLLVMFALNLGVFLWASNRYIYKRESTEMKDEFAELEGKAIDLLP